MCGIAGIYGHDSKSADNLLTEMLDQMVHRGPDGEGTFVNSHIALGVRRIAIVEREHGHQPLYNERVDVAVVFNGDI